MHVTYTSTSSTTREQAGAHSAGSLISAPSWRPLINHIVRTAAINSATGGNAVFQSVSWLGYCIGGALLMTLEPAETVQPHVIITARAEHKSHGVSTTVTGPRSWVHLL